MVRSGLNTYIHGIKLMNMNYMINDPASKKVAIAFAKWTIITGMWNSDLTFDEQYECWMKVMDDQAHDARLAYDSVDYKDFGAYIMER